MIEINIIDTTYDVCIIEITGHALYAPIGKDIVCSGVSALYYALKESAPSFEEEIKNGLKLMTANMAGADMAEIGWRAISEKYPENVRINRRREKA